jgi:hypothetical protein
MGLHDPLPERIAKDLEPILALPDPRPKISAYHSMPYAIFRYDPAEEFALRAQVGMLQTRLEQRGKRVTRISLAECLDVAMRSERPLEDWFEAERSMGTNTVVDTSTMCSPTAACSSAWSSSECPRTPTRTGTSSSSCGQVRSSPCTGPSPCSNSSTAR